MCKELHSKCSKCWAPTRVLRTGVGERDTPPSSSAAAPCSLSHSRERKSACLTGSGMRCLELSSSGGPRRGPTGGRGRARPTRRRGECRPRRLPARTCAAARLQKKGGDSQEMEKRCGSGRGWPSNARPRWRRSRRRGSRARRACGVVACEVVVASTSPAAVFYRWPVAVAVAGSRRHSGPVAGAESTRGRAPVELRRESGHRPLGEAVDAVQRLAHSDGRHAAEDA